MSNGFVHDVDRLERLGMPEAIFCEGKDELKDALCVGAVMQHLGQEW